MMLLVDPYIVYAHYMDSVDPLPYMSVVAHPLPHMETLLYMVVVAYLSYMGGVDPSANT